MREHGLHSSGGAVGRELSAPEPEKALARSAAPAQPPGTRGLPYFGCLNGLLRDPMAFWLSIAEKYGGIARVRLRARDVYLISDPDLLYELLITKRHRYRKNTRYRVAVEVLGEGLLLTEGDAWKRQRRIAQPAFKPDYVAAQVPWMAGRIEAFLDGWESAADGRVARDVEQDFLDLSQRLAGRYLMGPGFDAIADRFCEAGVDIKNRWPLPPRSAFHALLRKSDGWTPGMEQAVRRIDACVYEYLADQRKQDFADCGVLSFLVQTSREQGDEFSDESLRAQLLTLFFAGHETSSASLTWIHYLLHEHPAVAARLTAEVDAVVGSRLPTHEDVERLTYTEQVINESLRLYSPIHSLSRVALEDDVIGGYAIPAGSTIYVSLYATHRLARYWPDPHRFDPERFTPEASAQRSRFSFIPFAAGHRNCIGAAMAMTELKLAVAQIAQRYTLQLVPGHKVEKAAGTTMHPRYGMKMQVRRRAEMS